MKKNILVVDDNELILFGLAKALQSKSFAVQTAPSAEAAIAKLSFCPFDLCLLDVHLNDLMNGLQLMKIIKDVCPKTKIIIMTASSLDDPEIGENIRAAIANGACHFVAKPFNLYELTDVVQQVLVGDENFHTGFRFTGSAFVQKTRKSLRNPCGEDIDFQMSVIDQGAATRWSLKGKAVDISERGIGMLSPHPLKASQVIGFDEKMGNRSGVVVWSQMIDEEKCRVGIRFA